MSALVEVFGENGVEELRMLIHKMVAGEDFNEMPILTEKLGRSGIWELKGLIYEAIKSYSIKKRHY